MGDTHNAALKGWILGVLQHPGPKFFWEEWVQMVGAENFYVLHKTS